MIQPTCWLRWWVEVKDGSVLCKDGCMPEMNQHWWETLEIGVACQVRCRSECAWGRADTQHYSTSPALVVRIRPERRLGTVWLANYHCSLNWPQPLLGSQPLGYLIFCFFITLWTRSHRLLCLAFLKGAGLCLHRTRWERQFVQWCLRDNLKLYLITNGWRPSTEK